jgi:hypothetical protein
MPREDDGGLRTAQTQIRINLESSPAQVTARVALARGRHGIEIPYIPWFLAVMLPLGDARKAELHKPILMSTLPPH